MVELLELPTEILEAIIRRVAEPAIMQVSMMCVAPHAKERRAILPVRSVHSRLRAIFDEVYFANCQVDLKTKTSLPTSAQEQLLASNATIAGHVRNLLVCADDSTQDYGSRLQAVLACVRAGVERMYLQGRTLGGFQFAYRDIFTMTYPHLRSVSFSACLQLAICLHEILALAPVLESLELESFPVKSDYGGMSDRVHFSQVRDLLVSREQAPKVRGSAQAPLKVLRICGLHCSWNRAILASVKVFATLVDVFSIEEGTSEIRDQQWAALEHLGQSQYPTTLRLLSHQADKATRKILRERLVKDWTAAGVRVSVASDAVIKLEGQAS